MATAKLTTVKIVNAIFNNVSRERENIEIDFFDDEAEKITFTINNEKIAKIELNKVDRMVSKKVKGMDEKQRTFDRWITVTLHNGKIAKNNLSEIAKLLERYI